MSNANTATPHNDETVLLPAAVRMQMAAAEKLQRQHYNPDGTAKDALDAEGQQVSPVEPQQARETPIEPEPPQIAPATQMPPKKVDNGSTEQAIRSLEGRLRAVQSDLDTAVGELATSRANERRMAAELAALRSAVPSPAAAAPIPTFTPEEVETYGEEFLEVVGKKAQQMIAPVKQEFERRLADIGASVATTKQAVDIQTREGFFEAMDTQMPNWRDLNADKEFIKWLGLPDPISGATRFDLLDDAFQKLNVQRTKAIFQSFVSSEASVDPAFKATRAPTTQPGKVDLATLAAPGRAQTAQASSPAEKPVISRAEITQFYMDVTKGLYSPDQVAQHEAVLNEALKEGRVR